jgi:hypothetical protein
MIEVTECDCRPTSCTRSGWSWVVIEESLFNTNSELEESRANSLKSRTLLRLDYIQDRRGAFIAADCGILLYFYGKRKHFSHDLTGALLVSFSVNRRLHTGCTAIDENRPGIENEQVSSQGLCARPIA